MNSIFSGIMLMLFGAWLLARQLGVDVPEAGEAWPALLVALGIGCLAQYAAGRLSTTGPLSTTRQQAGLVFTGVVAGLLGGFLLAITAGPLAWGDLVRFWPVFPIIGGLAFLAQWAVERSPAARRRGRGLLLAGGVGVLGGGAALGIMLIGSAPGLAGVRLAAARWWPAALVVAGVALVAAALRAARVRRAWVERVHVWAGRDPQ